MVLLSLYKITTSGQRQHGAQLVSPLRLSFIGHTNRHQNKRGEKMSEARVSCINASCGNRLRPGSKFCALCGVI